ncbi:MAG: D-alanyl-D-alanine carboxypeptidase [Oscillospiraceae bacterium]|jgi:D-alanyl-D-alanine carboxypeptidase (penicillin-binding protein 5/6)|nr:D-alanyl-D-alanine carboxypeptidase [Oscillospiraceae bacterium]
MKRIISLILVLLMFNINIYSEEEDNTALILMEAETGAVLQSSNADLILPSGTLVKLMSQLIFTENIDSGNLSLDTIVTASSNVYGMKGASIWLSSGEKMSVSDLLKASIIGNANDATAALAEHISGTQEKFTALMNQRAVELGMTNTVFKDCTGLDETQTTTAYDMGLLCRELTKHKVLTPFMSTWRDFIRGEDTELVNENTLVKSLDGIIGLKAGHSGETYSLALAAERDNKIFIAVILNSKDKDKRFGQGKLMINSGFSKYNVTNPYFSSEFIKPVKVKKGVDTAVDIEPLELTSLLVDMGKEDEITAEIFLPEYITAPIKKGQKIGVVAFYIDEHLLYETPLITKKSIEKFTYKKAFFKLIKKTLS